MILVYICSRGNIIYYSSMGFRFTIACCCVISFRILAPLLLPRNILFPVPLFWELRKDSCSRRSRAARRGRTNVEQRKPPRRQQILKVDVSFCACNLSCSSLELLQAKALATFWYKRLQAILLLQDSSACTLVIMHATRDTSPGALSKLSYWEALGGREFGELQDSR